MHVSTRGERGILCQRLGDIIVCAVDVVIFLWRYIRRMKD